MKAFIKDNHTYFFYCTLVSLYHKPTRKELWKFAKEMANDLKKHWILIAFDMVLCCIKYGVKFSEYYNLDFHRRSESNRATFISTFYNYRLYNQLNKSEYRILFKDKIIFNKIFDSFLRRNWIDINKTGIPEFAQFIDGRDKIILKRRDGNSGNDVCMYRIDKNINVKSAYEYIKENNYDLAEEVLKNHEKLAYFNPDSLNTVRIVTISGIHETKVLFAGLRIGAKGAELDNISKGGVVANIDIDTGCLTSAFHKKKNTSSSMSMDGRDDIGYQLPFWDEVKNMANDAAKVIPQMQYIAWDIAITPQGPAIIEGNHSFGSVVLQAHAGHADAGLKPKLLQILGGIPCGELT